MLPGQSYASSACITAGGTLSIGLRSIARVPVDQVPHEQRDVLAPIAQRRHGERKHVEPVEQIAAEAPLPHFLVQIAVGGGDDAHVDVDRPRAAEPLDLAVLQHAQQLRLQLERQLADLVEEDRAAVGQLEAAGLRRVRAGEGAALAAEQLALDQRRRQRRAVDDDERPVAARGCADGWRGRAAPCPCRSRRRAGPSRRSRRPARRATSRSAARRSRRRSRP